MCRWDLSTPVNMQLKQPRLMPTLPLPQHPRYIDLLAALHCSTHAVRAVRRGQAQHMSMCISKRLLFLRRILISAVHICVCRSEHCAALHWSAPLAYSVQSLAEGILVCTSRQRWQIKGISGVKAPKQPDSRCRRRKGGIDDQVCFSSILFYLATGPAL